MVEFLKTESMVFVTYDLLNLKLVEIMYFVLFLSGTSMLENMFSRITTLLFVKP